MSTPSLVDSGCVILSNHSSVADPDLCNTTLVLATSLSHRGEAKCFEEIGFAAYLVKPLGESQLFDTLITLVGGNRQQKPSPFLTRHRLAEARVARAARDREAASKCVLLVEDNEINQEVATKMLELIGYDVDVACNGREASDKLDLQRHTVVLMDCEMPVMDGYEATSEIRKRQADRRRVPIIAVTANARETDVVRCLQIGMDDHMSKPISLAVLTDKLEKWAS